MSCPELPYSKSRIKKAGDFLKNPAWVDNIQFIEELDVLSAWRAAHAWHLSQFNSFVRTKLRKLAFNNVIVAQRLKRLPSIIDKLSRFQEMSLDRMQDIAGIRVVLNTISNVQTFQENIFNHPGKRIVSKINDYIAHPKADGYRSVHGVFRCSSKACPQLDGLQVELQIRTRLQHQWGTAVETLGLLTNSSIKTGKGEADFNQYFKLISALFSINEKCPVLQEFADMPRGELISQLKSLEARIDATKRLQGASAALKIINPSKGKAEYHVIELDTKNKTVSITPFMKGQLEQAEDLYRMRERTTRNNPSASIVLVSVGDMNNLKKAYPNFFLDTNSFIHDVQGFLNEK